VPHPAASVEWSTLAWSAAWGEHGWAALDAAFAAQPLNRREVLWLHDVEGWPVREAFDALGLMAAEGQSLLDAGRSDITAALAQHLGQPPQAPDQQARVASVAALLRYSARPLPPRAAADELGVVFTEWRHDRGLRPWHRLRWALRHRVGPGAELAGSRRARSAPVSGSGPGSGQHRAGGQYRSSSDESTGQQPLRQGRRNSQMDRDAENP